MFLTFVFNPRCTAVTPGELIRKNGTVGSTVAKWLTSPHHLVIIIIF